MLVQNTTIRRLAVLAVFRGTKMLWGRRLDSGKFTTPGGHLNAGETPEEGALRELYEETGLRARPEDLRFLGASQQGDKLLYVYTLDTAHGTPHGRIDPENEVSTWEWIEAKNGLPHYILRALHSTPNVLFSKLNLRS